MIPPEVPAPLAYAGAMGWLILIVLVVGGYLAWKNRVALLARVLGQSESRVDRRLNRRRD